MATQPPARVVSMRCTKRALLLRIRPRHRLPPCLAGPIILLPTASCPSGLKLHATARRAPATLSLPCAFVSVTCAA